MALSQSEAESRPLVSAFDAPSPTVRINSSDEALRCCRPTALSQPLQLRHQITQPIYLLGTDLIGCQPVDILGQFRHRAALEHCT